MKTGSVFVRAHILDNSANIYRHVRMSGKTYSWSRNYSSTEVFLNTSVFDAVCILINGRFYERSQDKSDT